jgi:hypothetical protein
MLVRSPEVEAPTEPWATPDPGVDVFAFTVEVDPATGELAWRYFGPNSHVIFGVQEARTRSLPDLLEAHAHPEDLAAAAALVESLRRGAPVETELRLTGSDGATRWVHWRGVPRGGEDGMLVDAVATDVTARRRLELRHRQLVAREAAYAAQVGTLRDHAALFRDANDNVLQRLFAARLRLDMLQRKLEAAEAHAVSTIAFQLDQASTDLREVIKGLDAVLVEVLPDTA